MKGAGASIRRIMALALLGLPLLFSLGCETNDGEDHVPPAGQGSVIIRNHTIEDIRVFIDGFEHGQAAYDRATFYDLNPGVYRFALSEKHGDRSYAADVDVLQGRLTFLEVWAAPGDIYRYDVQIHFD